MRTQMLQRLSAHMRLSSLVCGSSCRPLSTYSWSRSAEQPKIDFRQHRCVTNDASPPKIQIRLAGDPILKKKALRLDTPLVGPAAAAADTLLRALQEFREEHGFGRAIAAPQIGWSLRMLAVNLSGSDVAVPSTVELDHSGAFTMINPEIFWRSNETFTMYDDCMSFPDLLVRVARNRSISVQFETAGGASHKMENLPQDISELLQHEIDHLHGILSFDRMIIEPGIDSVVYRSEFNKRIDHYAGFVDYTIA